MIALLVALACSHGDTPPSAEAPFAPTLGDWTLHLGARWDAGGCALDDMHTYFEAESAIRLDTYRYGFSLRDDEGYWYPCTLADRDFSCELPATDDDLTGVGYDLHATYTPTLDGAFEDEASLTGVYEIDATCDGADCDLLTGFGPDYTTPCSLTTALDAELGAPD